MENKPQVNHRSLIILSSLGVVFMIFATLFSVWKIYQKPKLASKNQPSVAGEKDQQNTATPLPNINSDHYQIKDSKIEISQ